MTIDVEESAGDMLNRLGDDAMKWAIEFRKTAIRLGYSDMPEDWLVGWFANAIEHSSDVRCWRREKEQPLGDSALDDNDDLMCCNGVDCGCQGLTKGQYRAILAKQTLGEAVAWQVRSREKILGYWMGWGQCQSEEEAKALVAIYAELGMEAEWRALYTRSNAKAGEVDDGWMPIDSAPQNSIDVLVWINKPDGSRLVARTPGTGIWWDGMAPIPTPSHWRHIP